jgi:hypothetical protein
MTFSGWTVPVRYIDLVSCNNNCASLQELIQKIFSKLNEGHQGSDLKVFFLRWGIPIVFYMISICSVKLQNYTVIHNSQFIRSLSFISSYMFRLCIQSHLQASFWSGLCVQLLVLWKLRDLVLQIVVKIFMVILYKIYYKDKIQIYFTYWVLNIIIK